MSQGHAARRHVQDRVTVLACRWHAPCFVHGMRDAPALHDATRSRERLATMLERLRDRERLAADLHHLVHAELTCVLRRFPTYATHVPGAGLHDLVQDVLVVLFEHDARVLRRWDPARGRSLASFVRLVARRHAGRVLAHACSKARRAANREATAGNPVDPDDRGCASARIAARLEVQRLLAALARTASARDQALFDLLFCEERDPGEVARSAGMTRAAVNAWAYRLRRALRQGPGPFACRDAKAPTSRAMHRAW